mmetsp:Transcript_28331/g.84536  ORF Transcript_28331/g.84536 Transcript_28331/m.84536 type:complete len:262 (-) Transcript_28331:128-913(-)
MSALRPPTGRREPGNEPPMRACHVSRLLFDAPTMPTLCGCVMLSILPSPISVGASSADCLRVSRAHMPRSETDSCLPHAKTCYTSQRTRVGAPCSPTCSTSRPSRRGRGRAAPRTFPGRRQFAASRRLCCCTFQRRRAPLYAGWRKLQAAPRGPATATAVVASGNTPMGRGGSRLHMLRARGRGHGLPTPTQSRAWAAAEATAQSGSRGLRSSTPSRAPCPAACPAPASSHSRCCGRRSSGWCLTALSWRAALAIRARSRC